VRARRNCLVCKRTFSARTGTPLARLRVSEIEVERAACLYAEGMSKAAIARTLGRAPSTVGRWLLRTGDHARAFQDVHTQMDEMGEIQIDELACRGAQDARLAWAYSAMEVFTRLWLGVQVSRRTLRNTRLFMREVANTMERNEGWVLITTDKMKYYEPAMRRVLQGRPVVYQQVDPMYRGGRVLRSNAEVVFGPTSVLEELRDRTDSKKPNTSFVERLNLVKRTCCSLVRRRTASPARRVETLQSALEIVRLVYNYVRPHSSLRTRQGKRTPAMEAGLVKRPLRVLEVLRWVVPGSYLVRKRLQEAWGPC